MLSWRVLCPCRANSITITAGLRGVFLRARELQSENWRCIGGVWYCWACMGLPAPPLLRQVIAEMEAKKRGEDPDDVGKTDVTLEENLKDEDPEEPQPWMP